MRGVNKPRKSEQRWFCGINKIDICCFGKYFVWLSNVAESVICLFIQFFNCMLFACRTNHVKWRWASPTRNNKIQLDFRSMVPRSTFSIAIKKKSIFMATRSLWVNFFPLNWCVWWYMHDNNHRKRVRVIYWHRVLFKAHRINWYVLGCLIRSNVLFCIVKWTDIYSIRYLNALIVHWMGITFSWWWCRWMTTKRSEKKRILLLKMLRQNKWENSNVYAAASHLVWMQYLFTLFKSDGGKILQSKSV